MGFVFQVLCDQLLSCVRFFVTPQTIALQAPLSMGFPRQEYWNGLPFPSLEVLPNAGIELKPPALQADSLLLSHRASPRLLHVLVLSHISCVQLFVTLRTIAHQTPLSVGFSRQEY